MQSAKTALSGEHMNCERCGKKLPDAGSPRFCSQCGIQQLRGGKVSTGKTSSSSAPQWMKGCLVAFGIMSLLATLFVANAIHLSNKKTKKEAQIKANMVEYLNKKYNQKFAISKLTRINDGVFGSWYEAKAYRKDIPEIDFKVTSDRKNQTVFTDYGYGRSLWSSQLKKDVIKTLNSIYGSNYRLVSCVYGSDDDVDTDLNYIDKINKCKCGGIGIGYVVLIDDKFDKSVEAKKINILIKTHIQENKINSYRILTAFTSNSKFSDRSIDMYITSDNLRRYNIVNNNNKIIYSEFKYKRNEDLKSMPTSVHDILSSFKGE